MEFDFEKLSAHLSYNFMVSTIVPRPIALVSSVDPEGRINAAPFSFFNGMCSDPPVVVVGVIGKDEGAAKDTARNLAATGEFVVNLVDEALAERMNVCAVDFAAGIDELAEAGLTPVPSVKIKPPRIGESPVSFECRRLIGLDLGRGSSIEVGRIVHAHIRDDYVIDAGRAYIATDKMRLIRRMHGRGWYARTTDLFEMARLTVKQWRARRGE